MECCYGDPRHEGDRGRIGACLVLREKDDAGCVQGGLTWKPFAGKAPQAEDPLYNGPLYQGTQRLNGKAVAGPQYEKRRPALRGTSAYSPTGKGPLAEKARSPCITLTLRGRPLNDGKPHNPKPKSTILGHVQPPQGLGSCIWKSSSRLRRAPAPLEVAGAPRLTVARSIACCVDRSYARRHHMRRPRLAQLRGLTFSLFVQG